jgi:TatD DNase family protein
MKRNMLIDSHAHLNFPNYDKDRDELINKCLSDNIWVINVGTDYESSKKAIEISEKYAQGIFASVGMHPESIGKEVFDYKKYKELIVCKKVVAVGEIGLDYWNHPKTKKKQFEFKEKQKQLVLEQIKLAKEVELPIIFHCRKAHNDLLEILNVKENSNLKGVIHCFTGDWEDAKQYLEMGFYLGFTGIIFKLDLDKVIQNVPADRMLIETDCPFLSPLADVKRNEPLFVKYMAKKIAELKNISFEQVVEQTTKNAKKLFNI